MIKQSKLLKINIKILSNLLNEKYGLKLGEFNYKAGTEGVNNLAVSIYNMINLMVSFLLSCLHTTPLQAKWPMEPALTVK